MNFLQILPLSEGQNAEKPFLPIRIRDENHGFLGFILISCNLDKFKNFLFLIAA
jgi:hypothetical protein